MIKLLNEPLGSKQYLNKEPATSNAQVEEQSLEYCEQPR